MGLSGLGIVWFDGWEYETTKIRNCLDVSEQRAKTPRAAKPGNEEQRKRGSRGREPGNVWMMEEKK